MKILKIFFLSLCTFISLQCQETNKNAEVLFGADVLIKRDLHLLKNTRIGLIINNASLLKTKHSLLDTLIGSEINITAIFSPEHGFGGKSAAGEIVYDDIDTVSGIKIYSLYGSEKKPTPEMLKDVDVLIFDLQDIGARFYTYISTLYFVIEAAYENNIPLIVLDRPNPLGGIKIEGPVLNNNFKSFIGIAELPIVHGMTTVELAFLFADMVGDSVGKKTLMVIQMKNWKRELEFEDLDRSWVPTSPNIPDFETALIYPGTCLIEGTNVSEGRGTETPFKIIGAPFIDSNQLISKLESLIIQGVELSPVTFIPEDIQGKAQNPKFKNELCNGIKIKITERDKFKPVEFGIKLIYSLHKLYPDDFVFRNNHFDKLIGNDTVRKMILDGSQPELIIESWQKELNLFKEKEKNIYFIEDEMSKFILLIAIIILLNACQKKTENEEQNTDSTSVSVADTSELITSEAENPDELFLMSYKFEKGKSFRYKLTAVFESTQTMTLDSTITQKLNQTITYLIDFKPLEVNAEGIAELECTIKSVKLDMNIDKEKISYQSGKADSTQRIKFAEYEAYVNNPFHLRVEPNGSILEIFKAEKISNTFLIIKGISDSVDANQKLEVRDDLVNNILTPLITQIFRKVPDHKIAKDSSWTQPKSTLPVLIFKMHNQNKYRIENIELLNEEKLAVIEGIIESTVEGDTKYSERGVNYTFEKPKSFGKGKIYFNISKGLVQKISTQTRMENSFRMETVTPQGTRTGSKQEIVMNKSFVELL